MSRVAIVGRDADALANVLRLVHEVRLLPYSPGVHVVDALGSRCHPDDQGDLYAALPEDCVSSVYCPYMLRHFDASKVWCLAYDVIRDDVLAARLSSHPDFERWKDELDTGEFWWTAGESWVVTPLSTQPEVWGVGLILSACVESVRS